MKKDLRKAIIAGNWKMNNTPAQTTALIDLLTDDLLHFLDGAESQRQIRIGTIGDLSHHAGLK